MANIKSAKKRIKVIETKTALNKARKTKVKNAVKKVMAAVEANDKALATEALNNAFSVIDTATQKGTFHKKTSSRRKAQLSKLVHNLEA
ncbi:MAG: 30S ribosomal protein S20 [Clostridia bacterium]|jgi:small subunit ribosomal protein S20|nr:30S ribosomal protein S20 [Clostridia bacterium]